MQRPFAVEGAEIESVLNYTSELPAALNGKANQYSMQLILMVKDDAKAEARARKLDECAKNRQACAYVFLPEYAPTTRHGWFELQAEANFTLFPMCCFINACSRELERPECLQLCWKKRFAHRELQPVHGHVYTGTLYVHRNKSCSCRSCV